MKLWKRLFASSSTKFLNAASEGDLKRAGALLKRRPHLIFSKDQNGTTPLHRAAARGRRDLAEFLLTNSANVDARDNNGDTALHWAVDGGHTSVVELLLANRAEINVKGKGENTPLHYAAWVGFKEPAELLLRRHADVQD